MADFLHGKIKRKPFCVTGDLFERHAAEEVFSVRPVDALSPEARSVLDAGREIWRYYMSKPGVNVNASFLDIRAYFQGYKVTDRGKRMMNPTSADAEYMRLLGALRERTGLLSDRVLPKVYEYGFLPE